MYCKELKLQPINKGLAVSRPEEDPTKTKTKTHIMEYNPMLAGVAPQSVRVRSVWMHNADQEFALIRHALQWYRIASMDTEFPGVFYRSPYHPWQMTPDQHYAQLKANVDALNLVQVGLTLTDMHGRLPELFGEAGVGNIWEFNIRGFHPSRDLHVAESVELLRAQGMNFDILDGDGIEPRRFTELMMSSGLLLNGSTVSWVTFQGAYDFAYLIKMLTAGNLPENLGGFMNLVRCYFGNWVYDAKYMMRHCKGLYGGLEKVARELNVERAVGNGHQAGSDSLLTWRVFKRMRDIFFPCGGVEQHAGFLYGLVAYACMP